MKQTKPYRAALAQLIDVIVQQEKTQDFVFDLGVWAGFMSDLHDVLERRHPDFDAAMMRASKERAQRRQQQGIERRRATLAARKAARVLG